MCALPEQLIAGKQCKLESSTREQHQMYSLLVTAALLLVCCCSAAVCTPGSRVTHSLCV